MKDDRFEPGKLYKTNNIGSVHVLPTHDKLMVLSVERTSNTRDHPANYSVCRVITHLGSVTRMALYYVDWDKVEEETWTEPEVAPGLYVSKKPKFKDGVDMYVRYDDNSALGWNYGILAPTSLYVLGRMPKTNLCLVLLPDGRVGKIECVVMNPVFWDKVE